MSMEIERLREFELPASDFTCDYTVGDDGQDAVWPGWTASTGGVWIAWADGVTDPDGNYFDNLEDVTRDALAMLAAVRQVKTWRASREDPGEDPWGGANL